MKPNRKSPVSTGKSHLALYFTSHQVHLDPNYDSDRGKKCSKGGTFIGLEILIIDEQVCHFNPKFSSPNQYYKTLNYLSPDRAHKHSDAMVRTIMQCSNTCIKPGKIYSLYRLFHIGLCSVSQFLHIQISKHCGLKADLYG